MPKQIKSYRDLDYHKVIAYADEKGLNTDTPENWREAAQMMFNEKYGKKRSNAKLGKKKVKVDFEKFKDRKDDLNPLYIFGLTATELLVEALKEEFDLLFMTRLELAKRGLGKNGEWVGFKKAKETHGID